MTSPFPGMDPHLERFWGDVHTKLTSYAADALNPALPADLVARVEEYVAVAAADDEEPLHRLAPDVAVTDAGPVGLVEPAVAGTAVEDPVVLRLPTEPPTLRRLLITDINSGGRVVTAVEFLSPANKIGRKGRTAYRRKRREFLAGRVSVVEIDLLRDGAYILYPEEYLVPAHLRGPYRISAVRGTARLAAEMYPVPLRRRLPTIRVPLRPTDPDAGLDLQALIDQVYRNGRYGRTLDYRRDPEPKLAGDDAAWADELLKAAGKR